MCPDDDALNRNSKTRLFFQQAYPDLPRAGAESKEMLDYLLQNFALSREEDVVELQNSSYTTLKLAFGDLKTKLRERHR